MKIFSIALYPLPEGDPIVASIRNNQFGIEPHEKEIHKTMRPLADLVLNQQGVHKLKTPEGIYYAFITSHKLAIWALDEEISTHAQLAIFDKISKARSATDLAEMIKQPELAAKTKGDILLEQVDEVKAIIIKDIDKLIERQEKLEELLPRTENLARDGIKFNKAAKHLKQRYQCPSIFSFFTAVKSYFWKQSYEYQYTPSVGQKP